MREAKAEAEGKTLGEKFKELGYSPQSKGKGRGRGGGNKAGVVSTSVACSEGTLVERMRKGLVAPPPGDVAVAPSRGRDLHLPKPSGPLGPKGQIISPKGHFPYDKRLCLIVLWPVQMNMFHRGPLNKL